MAGLNQQIKQLCRDYVWHVLCGWDMDGFDYTGNQQRGIIHAKLADIFGVAQYDWNSYLHRALNYLESYGGLPESLPDREQWKGVAKRCGNVLAHNLINHYLSREDNNV